MNQSLISLREIAQKRTRTIIGLMSGTSLDGLDIALCSISGKGTQTKVSLERFKTIEYSGEQRDYLKKITSVETVSLSDLCYIHTRLAVDFAHLILDTLKVWGISPEEVDCIASHGQTIYHLPARDQKDIEKKLNSTLQAGDGDHLAARTGILTISDFRQKHTAIGREGAPLAALVDRILFSDAAESRILLNIGGIANFTLLPAKSTGKTSITTTDTGPGNTLIDSIVQHYFDMPFDTDGKIAAMGTVNQDLLQGLLEDPWFNGSGSKSTGPEYFNMKWVMNTAEMEGINLDTISPEDLVATVTELSARSIAESINFHADKIPPPTIYASGGGARNKVLVERIQNLLPEYDVCNFSDLGFDPDAKEAIIFAVLANEMLAGNGFEVTTDEGKTKLNLGKISFPN